MKRLINYLLVTIYYSWYKIKVQFLLMSIIAGIIVSCNYHKKAKNDEFVINGQFKNGNGIKVFLYEVTPLKSILIDSAKADAGGEYNLKNKIKEPGIYDLKLSNTNFVRLLIDRGENIDIEGDAKLPSKNFKVKGSAGSELLKQLTEKYYFSSAKIDSLSKIFISSKNKPDFLKIKISLDSNYRKIIREHKKYLKDFINTNRNSLASIIALYQKLNRQIMFDINNPEDIIYFEKIDSSLLVKYPENKHLIEFHKTITDFNRAEAERKLASKQLEIGTIPPDISLPNPQGKIINLYSLKGKVVLLDFWASWCKPCRMGNPELVKLYNKYMNKGFEIYGVSLDREKEDWINGISMDKIAWIQVSDLKYWSSPIVKEFNIEGIPYSILLSKEGKIVAKGLTGNNLESKIKEQISKK